MESYFLQAGSLGRLITWLEADGAAGSEETGNVKVASEQSGRVSWGAPRSLTAACTRAT